jgi:hypothetical protein
MNRFVADVAVEDFANSTRSYHELLGAQSTREKSDYPKWMLVD